MLIPGYHVPEILVEKALSQAAAGIGEECVNRSPHFFGGSVEFIDPLQSGEIRLNCLDCRAELAKVSRRVLDLRLVGGDHEVETILGAGLRQARTQCLWRRR